MDGNINTETRELRVQFVPEDIHLRVERWKDIYNGRTGEGINKAEAVVKLLEKATKKVKLIQVA